MVLCKLPSRAGKRLFSPSPAFSSSHPAVFAGLVGFDVLENAVCVWSLARTVEKAKLARRSASVSPSASAATGAANRRPSRNRRRTTVHAAIEGLPMAGEAEAHGVTYYIAATLLLREVVEIIVPAQTMLVLSAMHYFSGPTGLNGLVQGMDDAAYDSAMRYLGIDLGIEVLVFACTAVALRFIFPDVSVFGVIQGLLEQRFMAMACLAYVAWSFVLGIQYTYAGMDLTFKFDWMRLGDCANATWAGGLVWEGDC